VGDVVTLNGRIADSLTYQVWILVLELKTKHPCASLVPCLHLGLHDQLNVYSFDVLKNWQKAADAP